MRTLAPTALCLLAFAPFAVPLAAQVAPAGIASPLYRGFQIPTIKGTLSYSVSASERATLNYEGEGQTAYASSISGNFGYVSPSLRHPTNVVYSGGFSAGTANQGSYFFQSLGLQQGFNTRTWKFNVTDNFDYLPNTPSTGLSGIPGVGDVGVIPGTDVQQAALSPYATRVDNNVTLGANRPLTGKTSLFFTGGDTLQRFLGGGFGIDTDSYNGSGGISHRINGRSSLSGNYNYNQFSYSGQPGAFVVQGVSLSYSRTLTRSLQAGIGGGPQYIQSSASAGIPGMLSYSADAHLSYTGTVRSASSATVSFVRAANNGSGFSFGAQTSTFSFTATRRFLRSLQASAQVNYGRSTSLQYFGGNPLITDTLAASAQANRAVTRTISAFFSYSAGEQTLSGSTYNAGYFPLQGLYQTFSAGITYSPRPFHTGR